MMEIVAREELVALDFGGLIVCYSITLVNRFSQPDTGIPPHQLCNAADARPSARRTGIDDQLSLKFLRRVI